MAKTLNVSESPSWGSGYVIQDHQVQHLEGRLLTLVESFGMRETQEKAAKDLLRNEVWKLLESCFVISNQNHSALREKYHQEQLVRGEVKMVAQGLRTTPR